MNQAAESLLDFVNKAANLGFLGNANLESHLEIAQLITMHLGVNEGGTYVDIGSGCGLVGIFGAVSLPKSKWTLVDVMRKRVAFAQMEAALLGISERVKCRCESVELTAREPSLRESFDGAVARGFASERITLEFASPLVKLGGIVSLSRSSDGIGKRLSSSSVTKLGLVEVETENEEVGIFRKVTECPSIFPRTWTEVKNKTLV